MPVCRWPLRAGTAVGGAVGSAGDALLLAAAALVIAAVLNASEDLNSAGSIPGSVGGAEGLPSSSDSSGEVPKPTEAYNRKKHYGNTPTEADRRAVGGSPDHDPPLVKRYYEGDPARGEKPGYLQTPEERAASAADRTRMGQSDMPAQRAQGGEMSRYSRQKKKEYGLD